MDLKQLEYFLQLAKFEHVSQTADFLGISQPTLSKSVSSLEAELGIQLFDRIGNRIRLNNNGRQFKDYAKDAIELLQIGIVTAKQKQYEYFGNINIACWAYAPILMPCISEYSVLNPNVNFNVMQYTHEARNPTHEDVYDFILTSTSGEELSPQAEQFWIPQPLFSEDGFLVIAPKHPLFNELGEDGDTIDVDMVKNVNFIGMKRSEMLFGGAASWPRRRTGFFPKSYFQTDDFVVRMHALRNGLGAALIPNSCIEDARLLCPGMKSFKVKNDQSGRTVVLMRKKRSLLSEASLDFWNFVLDYYNLPPDDRQ